MLRSNLTWRYFKLMLKSESERRLLNNVGVNLNCDQQLMANLPNETFLLFIDRLRNTFYLYCEKERCIIQKNSWLSTLATTQPQHSCHSSELNFKLNMVKVKTRAKWKWKGDKCLNKFIFFSFTEMKSSILAAMNPISTSHSTSRCVEKHYFTQ